MDNIIKQVNDHEIRIRAVEKDSVEKNVRIDHIEKKVDNLEVIKDAVTEISITLKYMQESEKERDTFYKEQAVNIKIQSENLTKLTYLVDKLIEKVDKNEDELKEIKEKIEITNDKLDAQSISNIKSGSISFNDIFRKVGLVGAGAVVTAIIGWVMFKLGFGK